MKKTYSKPELNIESFVLSQTVAANCGAAHDSSMGGPTHDDSSTCGWRDPDFGDIVWTESANCDKIVDGNGSYNGVCYNAPDGGNNIFNS